MAGTRTAVPHVSPQFAAQVDRADEVYREQLRRRDLQFRRTLVREHRDMAERLLEANRALVVKALPPASTRPGPKAILQACKAPRGPGMSIVHEIADMHGLEASVLLGPSHKVPACAARFHAMYEIKKRLSYSSPQIAALFDRDHTSVLHALKRWPEIRERPDVAARLAAARAVIAAGDAQ